MPTPELTELMNRPLRRRLGVVAFPELSDLAAFGGALQKMVPAQDTLELVRTNDDLGVLAEAWARHTGATEQVLNPEAPQYEALVAFWDGLHPEIWPHVEQASALGKPVTIIRCPRYDDGQLMPPEHWRPLKLARVWTDAALTRKHGGAGYSRIIRSSISVEQADAEAIDHGASTWAELEAVHRALRYFPEERRSRLWVRLTTDSEWTLMCLLAKLGRPPLPGKAAYSLFKPESNARLEPVLQTLRQFGYVELLHTHGHVGHPENERCDELAKKALKAWIKEKESHALTV
jgi:ribonuclease HI